MVGPALKLLAAVYLLSRSVVFIVALAFTILITACIAISACAPEHTNISRGEWMLSKPCEGCSIEQQELESRLHRFEWEER